LEAALDFCGKEHLYNKVKPVESTSIPTPSEVKRKGRDMKRACFATFLLVAFVALYPVTARAGATVKLSDESEVELGFLVQGLARFTDFRNPDSNHAESDEDLILRRARLYLDGHYTEYLKFFLQTEAVANCKECVAGSDDSDKVRLLDASVNAHYKEVAQFIVGLQTPPSNREILTSDATVLTIDRPGITNYNLSEGDRGMVEFGTATLGSTNSGLHTEVADRDLGATFFGAYSYNDMIHFKYYAGLYKGVQKSAQDGGMPRYTVRAQLNLFDPEPGYYNQGTYLGTKKTIAIAYSRDYQWDVTSEIGKKSSAFYVLNNVDLFAEYPIGPGSVTLDAGFDHM
jgi:hypothetical protein